MSDSHVELLQPEDWTNPSATSGTSAPVFLMHDGGGTTFMYTFLSPLGRFVYGIRNPHFSSGKVFAGGVPEMGRLYGQWIREMVAKPDFPAKPDPGDGKVEIMLGGWSFGGLLSLQVAKELQDDPKVKVTGLLLVDSIFPSPKATAEPTPPPGMSTDETKMSTTMKLSNRAMEEARNMVRKWTLPTWESDSKRPRMVLLKAKDNLPYEGSGSNSPLDLERQPGKNLGWEQYSENMFEEVIEVDGHHFELYTGPRLESTTQAMSKGLTMLQQRQSHT